MTRPQYGKPETWPRVPEAKLHIFHTGPGLIRRLGFLPCYEVMVPDAEVKGIFWPTTVWGYERAQRLLVGKENR